VKTLTSAVVGSALLFAGCASNDPLRGAVGSYRNYKNVKGQLKGGRYTSPTGNFSCAVPRLVEPGAVMRDLSNKLDDGSRAGTVGFEDDFGTLYRVDWLEVAPDLAGKLSERELLERMFNFQVATYRQSIPQTSLEAKEPSGDGTNSILFFVVRLPQGSTIARNGRRLDCSRASLVLPRGTWVYSLTTQTDAIQSRQEETPEERKIALRSKLDEFLRGFEFK
jgi:hypothetical protein